MKLGRVILVQLAVGVAMLAYSLVMAAQMPDRVPTHWNLYGRPDTWGSKWSSLLMLPIMLAFMSLLTWVLPRLSPKQFRIEPFGRTYAYVMLLITAMFAMMHVLIVQMSAGAQFNLFRLLVAVIFIFFALIGNVMGKVKRNFWMGVRTPWTLASERVWHATHRAAGRLWLIGGVIGAVMCLVGVHPAICFAFLMVIALEPVAHSYVLYRRLES